MNNWNRIKLAFLVALLAFSCQLAKAETLAQTAGQQQLVPVMMPTYIAVRDIITADGKAETKSLVLIQERMLMQVPSKFRLRK